MVEPHQVERRRRVDLHDGVPLVQLANEVRRHVVFVHLARRLQPGRLVAEERGQRLLRPLDWAI